MKNALMRACLTLAMLFVAASVVSADRALADPCSQDSGPTGCIDVSVYPATLLGDVYMDGNLIVAQANATRLHAAPGGSHLIEIKKVTEAAAGFGDVFVYDEASQPNVSAAEKQIRVLTLRPAKRFLKGYLNFTCDIRGRDANQVIQCQPSADGALLSPVDPGQTTVFALPIGQRAIHVALIGADAGLWAPDSSDQNANIPGGRNAYLRSTFNRKGRLNVAFNVPGMTGDIYVDGALIAGQVVTATTFVAPGNHTVEGRNLVDPAAQGVYRFQDVSTTSYLGPNQTRAVSLRPRKEFLLGFGQITCRINGFAAGQDVRCNVVIDQAAKGTIEPGQSAIYNLPPGPHAVAVNLSGANAGAWGPAVLNTTLNITGGRTSRYTAWFNRLPATPTPAAPPPQATGNGVLRVVMCQGIETTMTIFSRGAIIKQESLHNAGVNEYVLPPGHYDVQFEAAGYYPLNLDFDIGPGDVVTQYIGANTC